MGFFDNGPITADATKAVSQFDPIPENVYTLTCTKSVEKTTQKGKQFISQTWEVDANTETFGGRKVFASLWDAADLHKVMLCAGMKDVGNASDFEGRTVVARVKITVRKDTGEKQNQIIFEVPKADAPKAAAPRVDEKTPW